MSFLVVIEGLDRTGKSTLARRLHLASGAEITHFSKPAQPPLIEYTEPLVGWEPDTAAIFDRFHIGELVWPHIFGREPTFTPEQRWYVDMVIRSRGGIIVKTERNMEDVKAHLVRDGEDLDPNDADRAEELFRSALLTSGVPVLPYSHGQSINPIMRLATHFGNAAHHMLKLTDFIVGNVNDPDVLVVGDDRTTNPLPFMPFDDTVGLTMMRSMLERNIPISQVAMTSIDRNGDGLPLNEIHDALFAPQVLAVGEAASDRLDEFNIPHTKFGATT